jgi:tyrosyl-tRNA synthetase
MTQVDTAMELISRGAEEILVANELPARLASGKPLRIKLGLDPTSPDIHLGHTIVINKLRHFQTLGHKILFLVGDYTAQIGDPTGRNVTRQPLSREEIEHNAQSYQQQVCKILDQSKTEVLYNSSWCKDLSGQDLLQLAARSTVARMLERDDFSQRYHAGQAIAIHEFLYPLLQGYDSVAMQADVELGGTDQKFNLLMGRELQRQYGQPPQIIITMPLLVGIDGVKKMSKSYGNAIGVNENPNEMFGKLMSISDTLMWEYLNLLSFRSSAELKQWQQAVATGANPRDYKVELGKEIVDRFHGRGAGERAYEEFVARFKQGALPTEIETIALDFTSAGLKIGSLLKASGLTASTSEALRLLKQGAVKLNGTLVEDRDLIVSGKDREYILQIGKRRVKRVKSQSQ